MKTQEFEDLVLGLAEDKFDSMLGCAHLFYGVDCNAFKLGSSIFEAIEDEDDGYRSYLSTIEAVNTSSYNFQRYPIAVIHIKDIKSGDGFNGYQFIDVKSGHCWLEVGTNYEDDYYPCFTFYYEPCKPKTAILFQ